MFSPSFFYFLHTYSSFFVTCRQRNIFSVELLVVFRIVLGHCDFFKVAFIASKLLDEKPRKTQDPRSSSQHQSLVILEKPPSYPKTHR